MGNLPSYFDNKQELVLEKRKTRYWENLVRDLVRENEKLRALVDKKS